ncbi:MAG: hypothetical protein ABIH21_04720 [Patescibacteria group bacterium]
MALDLFKIHELPQPWELDESWRRRLKRLPTRDWSAYFGLDPNERRMIESLRAAMMYYHVCIMLRDSAYPPDDGIERSLANGLVRYVGDHFDNALLGEGYGRCVDFRAALRVIEAYAEYMESVHRIASYSLARGSTYGEYVLLHLIIPYWLYDMPKSQFGPGFWEIRVVGVEPFFGKQGKVHWRDLRLTVSERALNTGACLSLENKFDSNPFNFFAPNTTPRRFDESHVKPQEPDEDDGLLGYAQKAMHALCDSGDDKSLLPEGRVTFQDSGHVFYVDVKSPTHESTQTLLDRTVAIIAPFAIKTHEDVASLKLTMLPDMSGIELDHEGMHFFQYHGDREENVCMIDSAPLDL